MENISKVNLTSSPLVLKVLYLHLTWFFNCYLMLRFLFLTSAICLLGIKSNAQNVNVTFRVNVSQVAVSPDGISIGGNFQGWAPNSGGLSNVGNGIWERTYQISSNSSIEFKFINGNGWEDQVESVPSLCGVNDGFGGYNRSLFIGMEDIILEPVCFSGCEACAPIDLTDVTFSVDMSGENVSPEGVHIAGNFQNWNPGSSALNDMGNGIWQGIFGIPVNTTIQFRFINGIDWQQSESVPADCGVSDGFGAYNRFLEIGSEPVSSGTPCFGGCYACGEFNPVLVTFSVDMANEEINPAGVFLTGSFNGFDPTALQMANIFDDVYQAVVALYPGSTIQYKFLNGPDFSASENVPAECGNDDGFGGFNRSYLVTDSPEGLPTVCFSSCSPCLSNEFYTITFSVNISEQEDSGQGVFIAGSFNDFNPSATPMTEVSPGIFQAVLSAAANSTLFYKFLNGPSFDFEEIVPSECGQSDGFGGYNRAHFIDADEILPTVCFSSCSDCAVSVTNLPEEMAVLFPNPSEGSVYLKGISPGDVVFIYDAHGRPCHFSATRTSQGLISIDITGLSDGIYLIGCGEFRERLVLKNK